MTLKKPFAAWLIVVGLFTYLIHEGAHWLAGAAFGADMEFGINAVRYLSALTPGQKAVTDLAGPLVTIIQAGIAFALVMRSKSQLAFAFLYVAAFMRVVAGFHQPVHAQRRGAAFRVAGAGHVDLCRCWWAACWWRWCGRRAKHCG